MDIALVLRRIWGACALSIVLFIAACDSNVASSATTTTALPTPTITQVPGGPYSVAVRRNLAYGPLPAEQQDLCTPIGTSGMRPGVIMIHGGGWSQGDKQAYDAACVTLADPAAYRDASPLFLVAAHSPPMLIVQGARDTVLENLPNSDTPSWRLVPASRRSPLAQAPQVLRSLHRRGFPPNWRYTTI